jgi:type VI secretion system protein ImpA
VRRYRLPCSDLITILPVPLNIVEEDLDQRLGLLQGSINHLIPLLKQVAIVNVPAFSLSDYEALLRQKNHLLKQVESYTDDTNSSQILEQFEQSLVP